MANLLLKCGNVKQAGDVDELCVAESHDIDEFDINLPACRRLAIKSAVICTGDCSLGDNEITLGDLQFWGVLHVPKGGSIVLGHGPMFFAVERFLQSRVLEAEFFMIYLDHSISVVQIQSFKELP